MPFAKRVHNDDELLCFSWLRQLVADYEEAGEEVWTHATPGLCTRLTSPRD
jgi:hypothetical protein